MNETPAAPAPGIREYGNVSVKPDAQAVSGKVTFAFGQGWGQTAKPRRPGVSRGKDTSFLLRTFIINYICQVVKW